MTLFDKYVDKIKTSTLGESDIIALRSQLNGMRGSMTEEQCGQLFDLVEEHKPRIVAAQSAKGILWLRGQWKTPRGVLRKNNPFGTREIAVLKNFSHFTLIGFYDTSTLHGRSSYLPVYQVHATDDSTFDYVPYGGNYSATRQAVYIVG